MSSLSQLLPKWYPWRIFNHHHYIVNIIEYRHQQLIETIKCANNYSWQRTEKRNHPRSSLSHCELDSTRIDSLNYYLQWNSFNDCLIVWSPSTSTLAFRHLNARVIAERIIISWRRRWNGLISVGVVNKLTHSIPLIKLPFIECLYICKKFVCT